MTRLKQLFLVSPMICALALLPAAGARAEDAKPPAKTTGTTASHGTAAPTGSGGAFKAPGTASAKPDVSKAPGSAAAKPDLSKTDPSKAHAGGAPAGVPGNIPGNVGNVLNTINGFMSNFGR